MTVPHPDSTLRPILMRLLTSSEPWTKAEADGAVFLAEILHDIQPHYVPQFYFTQARFNPDRLTVHIGDPDRFADEWDDDQTKGGG